MHLSLDMLGLSIRLLDSRPRLHEHGDIVRGSPPDIEVESSQLV
jgi:hypothetical protein